MVFAAWKWKINWKYNFGVVPGWGICTPFLSPIAGNLQLFQNKMTNTRQMPRGGGGEDWARVEMTVPLIENVILPGKLSILCDIQYVNKTARKSFKNIEQLGIFYKVIF